MAQQIVLSAYKPTAAQSTPTASTQFVQQELSRISASMANLVRMTPQVATKEPSVVNDGMIRLARSPWRPVAGTDTDAWVFWNAASGAWELFSSAP